MVFSCNESMQGGDKNIFFVRIRRFFWTSDTVGASRLVYANFCTKIINTVNIVKKKTDEFGQEICFCHSFRIFIDTASP